MQDNKAKTNNFENAELDSVTSLIEESKTPLFITGPAGSGKSTLLAMYIKNNPNKNVVVLASTGTAALNIKGQTIHKFFGFGITITPEKILEKSYSPNNVKIYKSVKTIIIDEVSMLRADLLDCIDVFLQKYGVNKNKAFGGVKMVFFGDLFQLPPVVTSEISEMFKNKKYKSEFFFSATVFNRTTLKVYKLSKIYRQKNQKFISILNRVRNNCIYQDDLQVLNSRVAKQHKSIEHESAITLTTVNKKADLINSESLLKLPSKMYTTPAIIEGKFGKELYPTEKDLCFKVNAQVMLVNNDSLYRWVNGSVGKITEYIAGISTESKINIKLQNGKLISVLPHTWEVFQFNLEGNSICAKAVGTFTQFPIRLAWAITIHKSQGKTFDKVNIELHKGAFVSGQLYVALSRCRSLEGVTLVSPIKRKDIIVNERIIEFMKNA